MEQISREEFNKVMEKIGEERFKKLIGKQIKSLEEFYKLAEEAKKEELKKDKKSPSE